MKKNLFIAFMMCALFFVGGAKAVAQEAVGLSEDLLLLANTVVDQNLSDPDAANKTFTKLLRKIRRDKDELLAAGKFFKDKNVYSCARICAEEAYKLAPQDIPVLMFNGEICMMRKDYGAAGQKFDEILFVDSTNVEALRLNARVYKYVNPHVALEMLERLKRVEPDNAAADKEIGDINYNLGNSKAAVKAYNGYFKNTKPADLDIRSMENYTIALFSTKGYQKGRDVLKVVMPLSERNLVFDRMNFFCAYENYELADATEALKYLTEKRYEDSLYIYLDYAEAAGFMETQGNMVAAADFLAEGLKRDSSRLAGWKKLVELHQANKNFVAAIPAYKTFLELNKANNRATDTLQLGVIYYNAAQVDSLNKAEHVKNGAEVFAAIERQVPKSYLGPLWRARILNVSDEPLDDVKGAYEVVLQRTEGNDKANAERVEALAYMSFYYLKKDNEPESLRYAEEVLKLDPTHGMATAIKNVLSK